MSVACRDIFTDRRDEPQVFHQDSEEKDKKRGHEE